MIKNERQYNVTKTQLENFKESLDKAISSKKSVPAIIKTAMIDGIKFQIKELETELANYEDLKNNSKNIVIHDLSELPTLLIKVRIAKNLTQEELANLLGMKYQQIQRYESQNYGSISMDKLLKIIKKLGMTLKQDIQVELKDNLENQELIYSY